MTSGGIFGPKLSGKTTLAKALARQYWLQHKIKTVCLDINEDQWDEWVTPSADEAVFWELVWKSRHCLVIVDEAAATIRREKTLIPVFTRLRHCNHKLLVIGHSGVDLLPVMRQQLDTIYLFRQPKSSAVIWSEVFTNDLLLQAVNLKQYEFIQHELYGPTTRAKLALPKKLA